jgi:hypothetical protein
MVTATYSAANLRCEVPASEVVDRGPVSKFFDVLPNNTDLTEEYLYAHQPVTNRTIPVYATNREPIGRLDESADIERAFDIIDGPVIVVARKGYAGRLFVVGDERLIVHEDAYAIEPKERFREAISLHWFAGHYSGEFQANRTSFWGIGDFPRQRLNKMPVVIPSPSFQAQVAGLYQRRDAVLLRLQLFRSQKETELSERIAAHLRGESVRPPPAAE